MKKNFVKKLALGLALVMTVGSVNMPVAAEAASEPGFKSTAVKLEVGQTKKYSTNHYGKWAVKKFVIGNKKVATISYTKGSKAVKVTGVAEGTTKLRADFKAYKSKKEVSARIPVTVTAATPVVKTAELASVKQTAANAFEATFTADASKTITAESFKEIVSTDGLFTSSVKSVTFSADGLTAKVEVYNNFVDAKVYNVTCADKTASFTASVGAVTRVIIETTQAQKGVETPISFKLYDKNDIDVTAAVALNTKVVVDVTGDYSSADVAKASNAKITMDTVGDKATVTVRYDALDGSDEIVAEQTVTCVDAQISVGATQLFGKSFNYADGVYPKTYLKSYVAGTTVYMDTTNNTFEFVALDKNGQAIAYDSYEFETSNDSVLLVTDNGDTKAKCAKMDITPVGTGTAQVIIKATKNDQTYTYAKTVTVKAAKVATSIKLSSGSVSISNVTDAYAAVKVDVLDQYGNVMDAESAAATTELLTDKGTAGSADDITVTATANAHHYVGITANGAIKGSYVVKVEASDSYGNEVSKKFSVNVKEPSGSTITYKLELSKNTIDLNPEAACATCYYSGVAGDSLKHLNLTVNFAKYRGGVFEEYVASPNETTGASITVKKGNLTYGTDLTVTGTAVGTAGAVSNTLTTAGLTYEAATNSLTTIDPALTANDVAEVGTYTVVAKYELNGKEVEKTATFKVVNTQEMPTVTVSTSKIEGLSVANIIEKALTTDVDMLLDDDDVANKSITGLYKYNAATSNSSNKGYTALTDGDIDNNKLTINRVQVKDTFYGVDYYYYVPVTRTFVEE